MARLVDDHGGGGKGRKMVRPATVDDAAVIAALLNAHLATTAIEWTDIEQTAQTIVVWLDEHETVLVAEDRGEVVGVAAYGWFRDAVKRPGYRFTVENTIHVREDRWQSGIGRGLMDGLIERARQSGTHHGGGDRQRHEPSIRFHQRLGFVEVGRMLEVGAKFGRWQDLVVLQLRLDDRPAPDEG